MSAATSPEERSDEGTASSPPRTFLGFKCVRFFLDGARGFRVGVTIGPWFLYWLEKEIRRDGAAESLGRCIRDVEYSMASEGSTWPKLGQESAL